MDKTPPSIPLDEQIAEVDAWAQFATTQVGRTMRLSILASLRELQASRLDAARYRWLCSFDIIPSPSLWSEGVAFLCPAFERKSGSMPKEELDAAIDAALPPSADKGPK
jgi:hypothetical protein